MATSLLLVAPSALAVSPPKRESAPAPLAKLTLEDLVARAYAYATTETRASSTRKAYLRDFRSFEGWCQEHGLTSLPATPATVAVYLAALAGQGRRTSTLERALAGIAYAHRARGCAWPKSAPAIANVMKGIRRRHGTAPAQKAPLNDADIEAMVAVLGDDLVGRRDRALLTPDAGVDGGLPAVGARGAPGRGRHTNARGARATHPAVQGEPGGQGGRERRS